jgi:DNA helicase II / ATP-dependent DNA helicase PcrA
MEKRVKILGTPGCGKTTELKKRYAELLDMGYNSRDITVMTFRKSAAEDIQKAIAENVSWSDLDELEIHVGTIHSICYRLIDTPDLLEAKDYASFAKEFKYTPYMKSKNRKAGIRSEDLEQAAQSGDLFDLYAWCKNTMTSPDKWYRYPGSSNITLPKERILQFFVDFDSYKKRTGKIDFTDMLQQVIDNKMMLNTKVLMVDEFQDLTPQMNHIFEMWKEGAEHVLIAGDPFQSIYGVFGGSPDFFNEWVADEIVILPHSHRLPLQIKDFARKILRMQGMVAPDVTAKTVFGNCITKMQYNDSYPVNDTELHLVRANYQIDGITMRFANEGKLFTTLKDRHGGWTQREIALVNAIISLRTGRELTLMQTRAIVCYFPEKMLDLSFSKKEFCIHSWYAELASSGVKIVIEPDTWKPDKSVTEEVLVWTPSDEIIEILQSEDPTYKMIETSKIFKAKINGIKSRKELINFSEAEKRRVMTIHGSKGLEATAVFLHTAITPKIQKAIVIPGKESKAEARVWYVGVTRALEYLYIVQDEGYNYNLPTIPSASEDFDVWVDDSEEIVYADW